MHRLRSRSGIGSSWLEQIPAWCVPFGARHVSLPRLEQALQSHTDSHPPKYPKIKKGHAVAIVAILAFDSYRVVVISHPQLPSKLITSTCSKGLHVNVAGSFKLPTSPSRFRKSPSMGWLVASIWLHSRQEHGLVAPPTIIGQCRVYIYIYTLVVTYCIYVLHIYIYIYLSI